MKKLDFKKITSLVVTLMMLFTIIAPSSNFTAKAAETAAKITVLATSDIHGNIMGWDYNKGTAADVGLAKLNTLIKEERKNNPANILVDAGDFLQGTPIDSYYSSVDTKWDVHPMVEAFNKMGYDSITLGNHEFNFGLKFLEKAISKANFDVLSANTFDKSKNATWDKVKPYKVKEVEVNGEKVKVGIIGVTTPGVPNWENAKNYEGLEFKDQVETVKTIVKDIKDKVDVIVVVSHSGVELKTDAIANENQVAAIAKACPELSLIVCGHNHVLINNSNPVKIGNDVVYDKGIVNGIPVMEPAKFGSNLAKADLSIEKVNGKWKVTNVVTSDISTKDVKEDSEIVDAGKKYHDTTVNYLNTKIGESKDNFISLGSNIKDKPIVDFVNEVQRYYGKAQLSQASMFNKDAMIKKGDITLQSMYSLYIYENYLYTIRINGEQLNKYLEWSAKYYKQFKNGDTAVVTGGEDGSVRDYNYDMVQGVSYVIDITKPVGSRIKNLTYNGKTIKNTDKFTIALNNYRFNGGGGYMAAMGFDATHQPEVLFDSMKTYGDNGQIRSLIIDYIKNVKKGHLAAAPPESNGTWKISPQFVDILSVNDLHGQLEIATKKDEKGNLTHKYGAPVLAGKINELRTLNPNTILVSAGDMFQGSPMSNILKGKPVAEFMNYMNFAVMAPGNHEFDWGYDTLIGLTKDLKADIISSNIYDVKTGRLVSFAKPYKMITMNGKKFAFVGVTTTETKFKSSPECVSNIDFKDPVNVVKKTAAEARKNGANYVIVVGHISAFQDAKTNEITGEAADLAKALKTSEVDAIVSGHSHQTVAGVVNNIPVVQGYYSARALGHISFAFDTLNNNKLLSIGATTEDTYKGGVKINTDKNVEALVDKADKELGPKFKEVLGKTDVDLNGPESKIKETSAANFILDCERKYAKADISFGNSGGFRSEIQKGEITMKHAWSMLPWDNALITMKLTGAQIKQIIEIGVAPDQVKNVGLIQLSGLKVKYDSKKADGQRVIEVKLSDGTDLDMNKEYLVEANEFLAGGGDNYKPFTQAKENTTLKLNQRDVFIQEVKDLAKDSKAVNTQVEGRLVDVSAK